LSFELIIDKINKKGGEKLIGKYQSLMKKYFKKIDIPSKIKLSE
jgi:hypothetical protein